MNASRNKPSTRLTNSSCLVLALCLSVSACTPSTEPEQESPENNVQATPSEPAQATQTVDSSTRPLYPVTRKGDVTDNYHGTNVPDPYRWLEQDVRISEEVSTWVDAQNALSSDYLGSLPNRAAINERMTRIWNFERASTPVFKGGRYWYSYNEGTANQAQVFATKNPGEKGDLILDPNTWSKDGTVALSGYWPSPDGKHVAYTIADGGTDWRIAGVHNLTTDTKTDDELRWLKFTGLSWDKEGAGFYYSRYPEPATGEKFQSTNLNKAVYYHKLGDEQSQDRLVFANSEHPERGFWTEVTDDGNYLIITSSIGTDDRYEVFVQDLGRQDPFPRQIVQGFEYDYTFIGNLGSQLLFRSNEDAPKGKVVAFDLSPTAAPSADSAVPASPALIVRETANNLQSGSLVNQTLVLHYLQDAASRVQLVKLTGEPLETESTSLLALPGIGSVTGFPNNTDFNTTFYSYSSINQPPTIYQLDVASGESTVVRAPQVAFNPDDYFVKQEFFTSKDGTRVPMFIAAKKSTELKNAATLLYGYGGFNISLRPSFSATQLTWMDLGGVYVQANLRGGGEYGNAWHKAGTKLQKQNVFDDFIAAAEYLIETGVTSPKRLGIHGRSNGGLLVGAVVNQRPDLFGAAIPGVGVMDMLRFNKFTAGRFWTDDYGSSEKPEEFAALYRYSPYHNIKKDVNYPPILITTADTDDRVVPGHSFKYTAALQDASTGDALKLLRVETRSGHGAGKPTSKRIAEFSDMWAFLAHHLQLEIKGDHAQLKEP